MSIREKFVETFGEEQARRLEEAAFSHDEGRNRGTDPFKWALAICIGFQCVDGYPDCHGITIDPGEFQAWVKVHGGLATHDGDVDALSVFAGIYQEYM